jgi:hypothetical protein
MCLQFDQYRAHFNIGAHARAVILIRLAGNPHY